MVSEIDSVMPFGPPAGIKVRFGAIVWMTAEEMDVVLTGSISVGESTG